MKPKKKTSQEIGRAFEKWFDLSAARDCYVVPFPPFGARRIGGGAVQPIPAPFDRVIRHNPTREMIVTDCKSTQDPNKCDVGDPTFVKPHQRENLQRAGGNGVIAGLVIEATAPTQRWIYWLDWKALDGRRPSLPWSDPRFVKIGRAGQIFDVGRIVAIYTRPAPMRLDDPRPAAPIDRLLGDREAYEKLDWAK